ncbi:amidohydrolase family protein [Hydrogenimonas urashimensis]|uniref:amidohydrolase family protein n=1 Tax=Hydrogenimonas urashimensis TaxID=2740515 RepID=UPI00191606CE|nr:amidohydrolase family protein [Hydrogenimonas urashimensis]
MLQNSVDAKKKRFVQRVPMLIKGAKVVRESGVEEVDIRIEDGKITEIGKNLKNGKIYDAQGSYIMPALVDIGVRVFDGKLRGGTLEKLAKSAYVNGFGTVVLSSLCMPRIDNEITLEFAKSQAELCADAQILPLLSGVTLEGKLADCSILLKEGAVGIEFESHIDGNLIRRLMEYSRMHGVKLFCHANDPSLQGDGVMHEGEISSHLGLSGIPPLSESSQVARIGEFAKAYGVETIIMGASTSETLKICRENPFLKAQVSIHHLLLNDEACDNYDTAGKVCPPLRDESERLKLLDALKNGEIAMLTSLHSPVSKTAKDAVFAEAAYGIEGISCFLPLLYTHLIRSGTIDLPYLVRLTASLPAESAGLGHRKGKIEVGYDADLVRFDPETKIRYPGSRSPYAGTALFGHVEKIVFL